MIQNLVPQVGMVATVRNRRAVVASVQPSDGPDGRLHLVELEYNDGDTPLVERLLWEREPFASFLPPTTLPDPAADPAMPQADFDALVRACRWTAGMSYVDPDSGGPVNRLPVTSPFHAAVQLEDFQLVPLLKAMRMPRVSLLIADDVGLGKTIEAGLILSEMLLRRRVRRVLILTPASLRGQWCNDELWKKFAIGFEIVDRDATVRLRQESGMDANPWRSFPRVISSYHYLKQPDVLEQFRAASAAMGTAGRLPWDLLIVDEAHNLAPVPFGEESDLCGMLRQVAPLCEHKIFLTATPHNGHTRSFTGLLEILDPVRFSQTSELNPAERARVQEVLVRRLKREINEKTSPPRFCHRHPAQALLLDLEPAEQELSAAFRDFQGKVRSLAREGGRGRLTAGQFAVQILGKRLLSCPVAFADSWRRCRAGMSDEPQASEAELMRLRRSVDEEEADDREAESRAREASTTIGAWLQPLAGSLETECQRIDRALEQLGLSSPPADDEVPTPVADTRYEALRGLIADRLMTGGTWRDDERLIVFTEYKTTLDYLAGRLVADCGQPERILSLYGGMGDDDWKRVKESFNDVDHPVRILLATDAAAEGLNLQETARYVLHFDIPWNPARLEQRNGRVDRHGQARDVQVWHFASNDDDDLRFMHLVARKVESTREDLGATGEVLDELTFQKLVEGVPFEEVERELEVRVEAARKLADIPRDDTIAPEPPSADGLPSIDIGALARELDLDPEAMHATLDSAMAVGTGRPRISAPDEKGRCRVLQGWGSGWSETIDDDVRLPPRGDDPGALPELVFDSRHLTDVVNGRPIYRPRPDVLLMHLAHPLMQRALVSLARQRFPGDARHSVSRWTVSKGEVPDNADGLIALTVEELAVNELRESFHHWIRTVRIPVKTGRLGEVLPHAPAADLRRPICSFAPADVDRARNIWVEIGPDAKALIPEFVRSVEDSVREQLEADRTAALQHEEERYRSRQGEVSALIEASTMARLERELEQLRERQKQGLLFENMRHLQVLDSDIEHREQELRRRRLHYEEVREQLAAERKRVLEQVIPKRFAMAGNVQILPVAVEIVLPGAA